eukprot:5035728-Amphidinium_carterae.1
MRALRTDIASLIRALCTGEEINNYIARQAKSNKRKEATAEEDSEDEDIDELSQKLAANRLAQPTKQDDQASKHNDEIVGQMLMIISQRVVGAAVPSINRDCLSAVRLAYDRSSNETLSVTAGQSLPIVCARFMHYLSGFVTGA